MNEQKNKILVIVGPTATGKTDLGLRFAKEFDGELVSCDSRQVYIGLDLISGKVPSGNFQKHQGYWEAEGIKIWMLDMVVPSNVYNVSDYIRDGRAVIKEIWERGKLPIVVGGTGYYLKGLLEGFANVGVPVNQDLRRELDHLEVSDLQRKLSALSSRKWLTLNNSDKNNKVRLIRAIEIEKHGAGMTELVEDTPLLCPLDLLQIGLATPKEILQKKIKLRLESRIDQGMIEEAERLHAQDLSLERMKQLGLECRYLAMYLGAEISRQELVTQLGIKILQYAKRQWTWFKRDERINWFDVTSDDWSMQVEKKVRDWYN